MSLSLPRSSSRLLVVFGMLCVAATVFSFAFTPLRGSQDEWWHLKSGQWIAQHGHLPKNDIFTYAGADYRWYNHEWLSQLMLYGSYVMGERAGVDGIRAIIAFKTVILLATFGLLLWLVRLRGAAWPIALLITIVAADISRRTIYPRPPIFSYLGLVGSLLLLYAWKLGHVRMRWLWVLIPATVIWGNLHGMVLLSIIACGAFAAGELVEGLRDRRFVSVLKSRIFLVLSALTAAVVLAAMAQPSGYHLFFLGRNFTADPLLQAVILEMQPPPFFLGRIDPASPFSWANVRFRGIGYVSFWLLLPVFGYLFLRNRGRLQFGADYLLAAFFLYQGLKHWRLLPLTAICTAAPLAHLATVRLAQMRPAIRNAVERLAGIIVPALAVTWIFLMNENGTFFQRNVELVKGDSHSKADYPEKLIDFIERTDLPDRMFSQSNYCGYTIWRLSPEKHKLFTDNRFDLFGSRFFEEELIVLNAWEAGVKLLDRTTTKSWKQVLDEHQVNFMMIRTDQPVHEALRKSGTWKHVYYYVPSHESPYPRGVFGRGGYSVWIRDDPQFAQVIERARAGFQSDFPHLPMPEVQDAMVDSMLNKPGTTNTPATNWRINTPAKGTSPIGR